MAVLFYRELEIIVDDDVAERLARGSVRANRQKHCFYATVRFPGRGTVILHRWIMGAIKGQSVDHINGNALDNRRANLRFCSDSGNACNRRKVAGKSTPYKGVHNFKGRFQSRIGANGASHHLGCFDTAEAAARAYDDAARRLHGEFACLNFPRPGERSALQRLSFLHDGANGR